VFVAATSSTVRCDSTPETSHGHPSVRCYFYACLKGYL
jgi:hypothetical protein